MQQYITNLLTQHYGKLLCNQLVSSVTRVTVGWVNNNYVVELQDSFSCARRVVIRLVTCEKCELEVKLSNLKFEMDVLLKLKCHNLPVPVPLVNDSEEYICVLEDDSEYSFAVVFQYSTGVHKVCDRQEWEVVAMAQFQGNLHRVTNQWIREGKWSTDEELPAYRVKRDADLTYLRNHLRGCCRELPQDDKAQTISHHFLNYFDQVFPSGSDKENEAILNNKQLYTGLVHSDLHDENVLVNENEAVQLSLVLDWDESYKGPVVVDVAQSIFFWCGGDVNYLKVFLNEYESARQCPLQKLEKEALRLWLFVTAYYQIIFLLEDRPIDLEKERLRICYLEEYLPLFRQICHLNTMEFLRYFSIRAEL